MPVVGPRFLIEAGFIIAVAVVAGIERLGTGWIVAVMAAAWLLVAAVEITISRRRARAEAKPLASRPPARPERPAVQPRPAAPPPPEPAPEAERPRIVAVPPPPPPPPPPEPEREPEPEAKPEPQLEPEPEPEKVIPLPTSASPREWNLWELERVAREHASGDVARDEERVYLLMYLREFAGPDGVLPSDFDGLVRDAFGDVLHAVG
jgi:outer membrane biosynthesis protein TonB